jgi:hypothetical protein
MYDDELVDYYYNAFQCGINEGLFPRPRSVFNIGSFVNVS